MCKAVWCFWAASFRVSLQLLPGAAFLLQEATKFLAYGRRSGRAIPRAA